MSDAPASVRIQPPLEATEITFLAAFATEATMRRVWPGQPSARSPWRPSADGRRLVLDLAQAEAEPDQVAPWLQFLSRSFLAPSTTAALEAALDVGLRGGHLVTGRVVVGGVREVSVVLHRVNERFLPRPEATRGANHGVNVVDLDARRPQQTDL